MKGNGVPKELGLVTPTSMELSQLYSVIKGCHIPDLPHFSHRRTVRTEAEASLYIDFYMKLRSYGVYHRMALIAASVLEYIPSMPVWIMALHTKTGDGVYKIRAVSSIISRHDAEMTEHELLERIEVYVRLKALPAKQFSHDQALREALNDSNFKQVDWSLWPISRFDNRFFVSRGEDLSELLRQE